MPNEYFYSDRYHTLVLLSYKHTVTISYGGTPHLQLISMAMMDTLPRGKDAFIHEYSVG